jgi:hypothetical protein
MEGEQGRLGIGKGIGRRSVTFGFAAPKDREGLSSLRADGVASML